MKVSLDKLMKELELQRTSGSTGVSQLLKSILTTVLEFSVANHTFSLPVSLSYSYLFCKLPLGVNPI